MTVGQIIPPYSTSRIKVVLKKDFIFNGEPILGRYLKVNFRRKDKNCIALLRVVDLQTENRTLANAEMAQNAVQIEGVKEKIQKNDVLTVECEALTAFEKNGEVYSRVNLDTIINSLEDVEFVNGNIIDQITYRIKSDVFYLGKAIDEEFDVPLVFQPFYVLNEAYHMLIAGQTGSGKSTEAKKILVAYAKNDRQKAEQYQREGMSYRGMNFLILDPVGEFAKSFQGRDTGHFALDLGDIWKTLGRKEPKIYGIDEIALDRWDMLETLIRKEGLLLTIAIKREENREIAIDIIVRELRKRWSSLDSLKSVSVRDLFNIIETNLERIYTQQSKRDDVKKLMRDPYIQKEFEDKWNEITDWFDTSKGKRRIEKIVQSMAHNSGETIVIDLSKLDWENPIKFMIMNSIFSTLIRAGEDAYRESDILNTMVMIDEAHRVVPERFPQLNVEEYKIKTKEKIIKAFRETRKLGIGWMVISTRISNLDKEIWEHSRVKLFGFGLSTGRDAELLKELYGKNVLEIYKQKIGDPYDLMSQRSHKFMIDGPVNVISRRIPEFYESYNSVEEFLEKNELDVLSEFTL